jgi:hypothetical protein
MQLTNKTFRIFAMKAYDNPYCLSEAEFNEDLKRIRTIKKMITHEDSDISTNIRLLVNHFISFYNVFDHSSATEILFFKMDDHHKPYANAILTFLNLPIGDGGVNADFYDQIEEEYSEA